MNHKFLFGFGIAVGVLHLLTAAQAFFLIGDHLIGPTLFITATILTLPGVLFARKRPKLGVRVLALSVVCASAMGLLLFKDEIRLYQYVGILTLVALPNIAMAVAFLKGNHRNALPEGAP